jgi:carbamoyl-phosphate synthase large subunit
VLEAAGVRILGTSPDAIDIAEDRRRFDAIAREVGVRQPENGTATSEAEAVVIADSIGYPVLVRPSYVLGGRAMEIVYDEESLRSYFERAVRVSEDRPVLIDRFLEDAYEADVDAIIRRRAGCDRRDDAAHRGRRHPLGRFGVRASAARHPRIAPGGDA